MGLINMNIKINKSDIILLAILIIMSLSLIIILKLNKTDSKVAKVYYNSDLVLTIDLSYDKVYEVDGYNGKVVLKVKNSKIKVLEEKSPIHLCSKQGYIKNSYETIVCLPNKIVIEIDDSKTLDSVVK